MVKDEVGVWGGASVVRGPRPDRTAHERSQVLEIARLFISPWLSPGTNRAGSIALGHHRESGMQSIIVLVKTENPPVPARIFLKALGRLTTDFPHSAFALHHYATAFSSLASVAGVKYSVFCLPSSAGGGGAGIAMLSGLEAVPLGIKGDERSDPPATAGTVSAVAVGAGVPLAGTTTADEVMTGTVLVDPTTFASEVRSAVATLASSSGVALVSAAAGV